MDPTFLNLYNNELQHLRETAGEFAREYPKIAGRLVLDKDAKETCPDPFVERLLEGVAFLTARVQLKLDAEFPRFTQSLLETVYPHYLSPTPSMAIVRFDPDYQEGALAEGAVIPRGTSLRSMLGRGERTACEYRTAHEVRLWPLRLTEARYYTRDLPELELPPGLPAKAALRLRLQVTAGLRIKDLKLDSLNIALRGADESPVTIYEQLFAHATAVVARPVADRRKARATVLPATNICRSGCGEHEALLPPSPRGFEGYRLVREYFAFPQRFLFFEVNGLAAAVRECDDTQLDVILVLKQQDIRLEGRVDATAFDLFCTPAINLFPKRADRILLSDRFSEFHLVPDRTRPLDFEVFEIQGVTGYGTHTGEEQEFRPFYKAQDGDLEGGGFFTAHRVPRVLTEKERRFGKLSNYTGTEVYLSLVDPRMAPYRTDLRELGVSALCTNRHLPIQMAVGAGPTDFATELSVPVTGIRCVAGPSQPLPSPAEGETSWRIISHLALNYLSLLDAKGEEGALALREMLKLYADRNNQAQRKQIDGLRSAQCVPVIRRVQSPGPIAFARGLQVTALFDEPAFEGTGVFLLGAVLEQFFARHVSINSFTETVIKSSQRGEIMRWPARVGKRPIV